MDYQVVFMDSFGADLGSLVRQIAIHNPAAGHKLGEEILQILRSKREFRQRLAVRPIEEQLAIRPPLCSPRSKAASRGRDFIDLDGPDSRASATQRACRAVTRTCPPIG